MKRLKRVSKKQRDGIYRNSEIYIEMNKIEKKIVELYNNVIFTTLGNVFGF